MELHDSRRMPGVGIETPERRPVIDLVRDTGLTALGPDRAVPLSWDAIRTVRIRTGLADPSGEDVWWEFVGSGEESVVSVPGSTAGLDAVLAMPSTPGPPRAPERRSPPRRT